MVRKKQNCLFTNLCTYLYIFVVVQSRATLCNPMDCDTPGFRVHHHLLEPAQTHVHWVGDAIQPSHPLLSPSPLAFNLYQHQGFFLMSQPFASSGQSVGATPSSSVIPMDIQDWFPLGLTALISLQYKGFSRVFSNTKVQTPYLYTQKILRNLPTTIKTNKGNEQDCRMPSQYIELYTLAKSNLKSETKKTIQFIIVSQRMKYLE